MEYIDLDLLLSVDPKNLLLLLGLSFFFGLAFEDMYGEANLHQPGGVRTFPLLGLAGTSAYLLEPRTGLIFGAGVIILGLWLLSYYRHHLEESVKTNQIAGGLVVPTSNLLAYLLGPITVVGSTWVAIGITVSAVMILSGRDFLHSLARNIPSDEIAATGKFLILTGIILPLLPNEPITPLTTLTPYQVWLAVVVVSSLSYGSYLLQRYSSADRGVWLTAVLGGLYSSTATTVVLSRHAQQNRISPVIYQSGVVMATAMMFIRLIVIIGVFNLPLAKKMISPIGILFVSSFLVAAALYFKAKTQEHKAHVDVDNKNPLELSTALTFAVLFVLVTLATTFAKQWYGTTGIYTLGAIVGVVDIAPFVLSLAQDSVHGLDQAVVANAILIAASSNNVVKGGYAIIFGGKKVSILPALILSALAMGGFALAFRGM